MLDTSIQSDSPILIQISDKTTSDHQFSIFNTNIFSDVVFDHKNNSIDNSHNLDSSVRDTQVLFQSLVPDPTIGQQNIHKVPLGPYLQNEIIFIPSDLGSELQWVLQVDDVGVPQTGEIIINIPGCIKQISLDGSFVIENETHQISIVNEQEFQNKYESLLSGISLGHFII